MQPTATRVFNSGNSQAVRIPKQFRLDVAEVYIRQDAATGDLILTKRRFKKPDWKAFFAIADQVPPEELEGFMDHRKPLHEADRDLFPDAQS